MQIRGLDLLRPCSSRREGSPRTKLAGEQKTSGKQTQGPADRISQIKPDLKHITVSSEQIPGLFNYISQQVSCFLNFYFLVLNISVLRGNNLGHSGQNRPFLNM